mgnify:CR=1 FL=1
MDESDIKLLSQSVEDMQRSLELINDSYSKKDVKKLEDEKKSVLFAHKNIKKILSR